jgi:outer membrane protein assembly factor BamB
MATNDQLLVIGIGGHAVAIDQASGSELWRTKLKGGDFVTVSISGGRVLAGAGGNLFCLDATTGSILWQNPLKRLGLGVITFSTSSDAAAIAAAIAARRRAAAAAAS